MRLSVPYTLSLVLAAAVAWLVVETRDLAELAGREEVAARAARAEAEAARRDAEVARAQVAKLAAEHGSTLQAVMRLEGELAASQGQLGAMADRLRERSEAEARAAAEADAAQARARQPMPAGVRLCLQTLHECLRAEGFSAQRFLSARHLDGEGLHDVELLDAHADGLGTAFVRAARMVAELDRGAGRLTLRFFDGHRTDRGLHTPLPKDGWSIEFTPVDSRLFEERLPYLVRCEGVHPDEAAQRRARAPTDVDVVTRGQWLERFDRLLAAAGTQDRLRVQRFSGMAEGRFLGVQVLGTDDKLRLLMSADCERLAVEVDEAAAVVSLLLQNGVLRRAGIESTISAEGYRMLLPNVTPTRAIEAMLGMVVRK